MSANKQAAAVVQKDWEDREFIEVVQLNILKITAFLNQFDSTMRYKIGNLNEKLNKLERAVEYCEAATKSSIEKHSATR